MSNRNDFDDLFDDFDDDDGDLFDNSPPAASGRGTPSSSRDDDFFSDFEDDDLGTLDERGLDDDLFTDDFSDLDETFLEEERAENGGPSRTFVILAGLMILLFLVALGLVIFLALQDGDGDGLDPTRTAIAQLNNTQIAFLQATQTQAQEDVIQAQTQTALDLEATQTAIVEQQTQTAEAIIEQTEQAIAFATQTAEAEIAFATQTAEAIALLTEQASIPTPEPDGGEETPTPETPPTSQGPADVGDVALTATALFEFLQTPIATPGGPGTGGGGGDVQPTQPATGLPETGLFDNVSSGQSMGLILLAAFGLVGMIFGARRLRTLNNRQMQ